IGDGREWLHARGRLTTRHYGFRISPSRAPERAFTPVLTQQEARQWLHPGFCNGPRLVKPRNVGPRGANAPRGRGRSVAFALSIRRGLASVRGRREAAT